MTNSDLETKQKIEQKIKAAEKSLQKKYDDPHFVPFLRSTISEDVEDRAKKILKSIFESCSFDEMLVCLNMLEEREQLLTAPSPDKLLEHAATLPNEEKLKKGKKSERK